MGKLSDIYYDAIVISDEIDPNHAGAVRAMIIGVTDDLNPDEQPFILPVVNSMQAVPTKGTLMRVVFDDGDIHKGKYLQTSAETRYLPDEYVSDYPNVAVSNLGGDFFHLVHNRRTRESQISHPSNSQITWTSSGSLIHNSDKGYNNAGRGAVNSQGARIHAVLTEATIDPFTCTPVGNNVSNGGAYQGSEYMFVTHMSTSVADAINGRSINDFNTLEDIYTSNEVDGIELEFRDLYNSDGSVIGNVSFYPIESYIEVRDKEITRIIVDKSGSDNFVESASKITDGKNDMGVHYLIGRIEGIPPVDSEREGTDMDKQKGFIQFVDIKHDVHYMSEAITYSGEQANDGAIVIMLSGTGASYTEYQYQTLSKLVDHIRYEGKNNGIPIIPVMPTLLYASPPVDGLGNFDISRII